MDGKAFAKLCKDCKLLDPKFTSTDVDLIFANNKVKNKAERKITFLQFTVALDLVAERKGVPVADIHQKLLQQGGPATNNTQKAETSGIYNKLTDTSLYTGAHKSRFDEGGKGKGLSGRDSVAKGSGTSSPSLQSRAASSLATRPASSSTTSTGTTKTQTSGGIFARLTDSSQYTGAHKHRFDESGKGRGLAGRDVGGNGSGTHGGRVGDLSSMTRTNLNK